ncbi:MAG: hypothetical protein KFF49_09260 [Bacteroidales bacterium]|nr:hypothetical protein [Bacteroidales bacterium]
MYHVITIGIISVILYFLTFTGSKFGIITKRDHRYFWNIILLFTFLITATAGIFLALQSNYKWDIQGLEKILSWHVDFGIALSFTALIHLTWHVDYYTSIFSKGRDSERSGQPEEKGIMPAGGFRTRLLLLGLISGIMQVIFIREVLNLSGGYELAAGAVFACWILVSALGAKLAGKGRGASSALLSALLPAAGILSLVIYVLLSKLLIDEGLTPGLIYTLAISILSLIPFCILSGYLFVRLSFNAARHASIQAGNSFALETVGSMIAGILVTLVSGNILGNFQILAAGILLYYIIFLLADRYRYYGILSILASICLLTVLVTEPDTLFRDILLGSVKVTGSTDSRYGNIAIGEYQDERSLFYNHRLIDYEQDAKQREENIHYAMVQHKNPEDILIISGGADKHIQEALKYPSVKSISYVERDPALIACTHDTSIRYTEAEVLIESDDAFSFIRRSKLQYDVIISLLGEPDNIVTNRFYTSEYFNDISDILDKGGIFMLKAGSSSSYISDDESAYLSTIYNSLASVFTHLLPLKGESIYILASDAALSTSIPDLIGTKGIENTYVNSYYLNNEIIKYNTDLIAAVLDSELPENRLDKPQAVFHKQSHQMKKAGSDILPVIIIICLFLLLPFFAGSSSSRTMYSTSLNLAGTEILALILIQSTAGNFYQLAGLLIAVVMAGLAIGSAARPGIGAKLVDMTPLLLGLLAIMFALVSPFVLSIQHGSLPVVISLCIVIVPALLAGYYYRSKTAGEISPGTISGIYFADLFGAALGFMVIAGLLVPLYGIKMTFFILAFLNFASYITSRLIITIRKLVH